MRRSWRWLDRFGSREQSCRAMRSLLVDMARERLAKKRSGELLPLTCGAQVADDGGTPEQLLEMEEALQRLGKIDARLLKVAELRVILGMDIATTAVAMGPVRADRQTRLAAGQGLPVRAVRE